MFTSLGYRVRSLRSRFVFYWLAREKDGVGFAAMLAVPFVALGAIVFFAYADRSDGTAVRLEASRARDAEVRCLAENIYFEARGEPLNGQYAVAEVTLNRVASPHYPDTICEVVHEKRWDPLRLRRVAHFSWTQQRGLSPPHGEAWDQALRIAETVYEQRHMPMMPEALHYHATSVRPYWARKRKQLAQIGKHIFYR